MTKLLRKQTQMMPFQVQNRETYILAREIYIFAREAFSKNDQKQPFGEGIKTKSLQNWRLSTLKL
ncbi:MAG TPA: hypothetical protein DCR35_00275 [Runella sp.]|nr:hypothetical protein [Runella sp.]